MFPIVPASPRAIDIEDIESATYAPVSPPYVERLSDTNRREYLDRVSFRSTMDLAHKLDEFQDRCNAHRVHRSLHGSRRNKPPAGPVCPLLCST